MSETTDKKNHGIEWDGVTKDSLDMLSNEQKRILELANLLLKTNDDKIIIALMTKFDKDDFVKTLRGLKTSIDLAKWIDISFTEEEIIFLLAIERANIVTKEIFNT